MQSASWPVRPSASVNDSPYSRILKHIDEEARGVSKAEAQDKEEAKEEDSSASTSTEGEEESEAEKDAPCPEHDVQCVEIPQHHLVQVQKRQKAVEGGHEKDIRVSDNASIRSRASTTKRRPAHQPGILESLFLPSTTRSSTARRRSTTDIKGKAASIHTPERKAKAKTPSSAESTKAPSISSKRSTGSISTPQKQRKSSSRSISLFASPPPPSPPVKVECVTCLDDVPVRRAARLECKHRMCHSCLKRVFTLSTTDPQLMPPRCCTEKEIPLAHVDKLFDVKFKVLWNRKFAEYATKNRLYCPRKGCGIWIKPKYIGKDKTTGREIGICKECKMEVCKKCNMKWHGRRECENDEGTKRVLELGKEQGWKRCYNCREMVQLAEGCNHMRCRCKAEFCMVCAKKWKTCDCPWFNLPPELNVNNFRMPFGFPGDMPPPVPMGRRGDNQWQVPIRGLHNLPPPPPGGMGLPPPPPPFRDRRDDPFDPLELPAFFEPDFGATMRSRARRARPPPANDLADRDEQEAADADLARQLQEQELGTTLDEEDDFASNERRQRARRARRRVYAVTEDNDTHRLEERHDQW
ncbi:hypothetical protein EG328_001399 [Venturia inaequalis]|uniref:RBR-type E3 ubiquitin transferase n=1 Tax=Venturia inaequalis TaxID=5025 RepID=A0A8H3VN16_VENIN|nr:hypothetical protein EG328_001399 [Venturia inaequalis]KAE9993302.1 hypothetical protein EG327_005713 [Venturia inaequalis]